MICMESPVSRVFAIGVTVGAVVFGVLNSALQAFLTADAYGQERLLHFGSEAGVDSIERETAEADLERNIRSLETLFHSMPKNSDGRLEQQTAAYMLHRYMFRKHGWFLKGLQSLNDTLVSWSTSSPIRILEKHVPDLVLSSFRDRAEHSGLDLKDLAIVASSIEHLAREEAVKRLQLSYSAHGVTRQDILSKEDAVRVLHIYMSIYILGYGYGNTSGITAQVARQLDEQILDLFPSWPQTEKFVDEVFSSFSPKRDYLYFGEVESVFAEVTDRYGHYQDIECREMKDWLVAVEDKSADGAGRVRLPDFYNLALNEGRWQFSEAANYLRQLGALDESDASDPRVIIPNYVNSPSNCVASSLYYSVCCLDECDGILGDIEQKLSSPTALATIVANIVRMTPSSTVPSNRTLAPWLLRRLDQIASHHGGYIPIHGRLFLQWLHFAYPRECTFPHVAGTISRKRPEDMGKNNATEASKEEMERLVAIARARPDLAGVRDESPMWSMEEDLVAPHGFGLYAWRTLLNCRGLVLLTAVLSFSLATYRILNGKADVPGALVKHFV